MTHSQKSDSNSLDSLSAAAHKSDPSRLKSFALYHASRTSLACEAKKYEEGSTAQPQTAQWWVNCFDNKYRMRGCLGRKKSGAGQGLEDHCHHVECYSHWDTTSRDVERQDR